MGHRDLVPKAGLARGYDPLKEPDRFASTDLLARGASRPLLSPVRTGVISDRSRAAGITNSAVASGEITRGRAARCERSRRASVVEYLSDTSRLVLLEPAKAGIESTNVGGISFFIYADADV